MKDFIQYVEEMGSEDSRGELAKRGRKINQPRNMRLNRYRKPSDLDGSESFELIDKLKKPEVQKAVAEILQAEPQTAEFLKDILDRALRYAAMDHYNKPSFPGWSGGWSDTQSAASNFVGDNNE